MALRRCREGVFMKADASGGGQFSGDVVTVQHDFMVARFDDFFTVRIRRTVLTRAQMPFKFARGRQNRNARQLPTVDMAKALNAVEMVPIACAPIGVNGVVGTQVNHTERTGSRVKKEPTRIGRIDNGVY